MLSIGVDIEDISRFENKNLRFLKRIFTENEISYCLNTNKPQQHLCARFCAKEAVIKALSSIGENKPRFLDIEVLKKENGAPYLNILIEEYKKYNILLSISHENNKAVAFVIIE